MQKLLDSYEVRGSNLNDFRTAVQQMTDRTEIVTCRGDEILFCTNTRQGTEDGILTCPADVTETTGTFTSYGGIAGLTATICRGWDKALWDEATNKFAFFVHTDKTGLMSATSTLPGDFARLGISKDAAENPSYHLLGLVSQLLRDKAVTLCIRNATDRNGDAVRKLYALRSGAYMYIPQTEALEIAEEICSSGEFAHYFISNSFTCGDWAFPEKAANEKIGKRDVHFVPHIHFITSDTGEASCIFKLGWECGNTSVFLASGSNSVSRKHVGDWSKVKVGFNKEATKLLDKLNVLVEQMRKQNLITFKAEKIKGVAINLCEDSKIAALGKNVAKAIVEAVAVQLCTEQEYTGAEIILTMMEQQETLPILTHLSDTQKDVLKHCCGELPYCRLREKI